MIFQSKHHKKRKFVNQKAFYILNSESGFTLTLFRARFTTMTGKTPMAYWKTVLVDQKTIQIYQSQSSFEMSL